MFPYIINSITLTICALIHHGICKFDFECGKSNDGVKVGNIRGGSEVAGHPWPWIASIRKIDDNGEELLCAGTLIGETHILTAAHCVFDKSKSADFTFNAKLSFSQYRRAEDLFVLMGTSELGASGFGVGDKAFLSSVNKIHVHPEYQNPMVKEWAFDMALLELKKAPKFVDVARHACLPLGDKEPDDNELCIAVGWGRTENDRSSHVLRQATIPIVGRTECNQPRYWKNYVDKNMICAGDMLNAERASHCNGDSGAPLLCLRENDQWYIYGVTSWGPIICGDKPGVYTNVAVLSPWIAEVLINDGEQLDYLVQIAKTLNTTEESTTQCDAARFERKPGWMMFGPVPTQYLLFNVSERECMEECCERGAEQCQSFVYYQNGRKCRLREIVRCSRLASLYEAQSVYPRNNSEDVVYVGLRKCDEANTLID